MITIISNRWPRVSQSQVFYRHYKSRFKSLTLSPLLFTPLGQQMSVDVSRAQDDDDEASH